MYNKLKHVSLVSIIIKKNRQQILNLFLYRYLVPTVKNSNHVIILTVLFIITYKL